MGFGHLGVDAAQKLRLLGFPVSGSSRTLKHVEGLTAWAGTDVWRSSSPRRTFSSACCRSPAKPRTSSTAGPSPGCPAVPTSSMRRGVNTWWRRTCSAPLTAGTCPGRPQCPPGGAAAESHPFWSHPRITITPHIASLTDPRAVAPQLVENYRRVRSGLLPLNVIDIETGY